MKDDMNLDQAAIQAAVIDRVADEIQSDWDWKSDARAMIAKKIDDAFINGVAAVVTETVRLAVDAGFDHEYSKGDVFGHHSGPKTTIRAELVKMIDGYWTQKVDRNGKPSDGGYGDKITRAEWHMIQVCGDSFSKDMKQEVVNIAAGFKDGLRAQLRGSMDKMLNDLFKVKSTQDATEKLY